MSLKRPRSIATLFIVALAVAIIGASCGGSQPASLVGPSAVASAGLASSDGSARVTTSSDESGGLDEEPEVPPTPEPTPAPEPAPAPDPAPAPPPVPVPDTATNPGPWPSPPTRFPVRWTPTPETHDYLTVKSDPLNPVPFSGVPVPLQSCEALPNTWYYTTIIHSRTGNIFRIVERENYFDGFLTSRTSVNIEIPGQQNVSISTRWCSGYGKAHTAQHRFRAVDQNGREVILNGPLMQLQQNPTYVPPPPTNAPASRGLGVDSLLVYGD